MKFYIDTLGCPKNEADSSVLENLLVQGGNELVEDAENADAIIVNTCGFILDAKQESIDAIVDYAVNTKGKNPSLKVYAWGCLVQRYFDDLVKEIPEVDGWLGLDTVESIHDNIVSNVNSERKLLLKKDIPNPIYGKISRKCPKEKYFAHVKIGDGCDRSCAFCAIPGFKGRHISRKKNDILEEIEYLVKSGIREIILVDQDTTQYSYKDTDLKELLKLINDINGDFIVRVMYLHPDHIDTDTIDTILECEKVANYFDIPVQHYSNNVLKNMNRIRTGEEVEKILNYIREKNPYSVLRTTVMVGFPGETQEDYESLLDFIKRMQFDRLGAFVFSPEEGTPSEKLILPSVPADVAEKRHSQIMETQEEICENGMQRFIDKEIKVIIEEMENGCFIARGYIDAPDIDGVVYLNYKEGVNLGDLVKCKITDSLEYDLEGEIL